MGVFDFFRTLLGGVGDANEPGGSTASEHDESAAPESGGEHSLDASRSGDAGVDDGRLTVPGEVGDGGRVPPGALVANDRGELRDEAEELAEFWSEFDLDFTPASIPRLDELFATQQDRANYLRIELEDGRTGVMAPMASAPACYFGETLVRTYGADWTFDEDFGWALRFPGGEVVNLFKTAHQALEGEPPFVRLHDTFVEQFGLNGDAVGRDGDQADVIPVDERLDPDAFDEAALEEAAADRDPEEVIESAKGDAEDLVSGWPAYELDYSVDSLERLDDLVATEFDRPAFADAEIGSTDDEASIVLTAHTVNAGAYFGEVLRRATDATWHHSDAEGLRVAARSGEGHTLVDPIGLAENCIAGDSSFAGVYDAVCETIDLVEAELSEAAEE